MCWGDGGARLVVAALRWLVTIALGVRRPQRQVVSQQLHDQCRVLVRVLVQCVQFGDRVIERLQPYHKYFITSYNMYLDISNYEIDF